MNGFTDKPTISLGEDSFGVEQYIKGLNDFIMDCNTPMTIAIQGDWGSGKTSMMNMIREQLGDKVVTTWFNTWQYSQFNMQEELTISMMCNLLSALGCEKNTIEKVVKIGASLMKGAFKFGASAVGAKELADEALKHIETNISDYATQMKN